jgi:hypothetical protein
VSLLRSLIRHEHGQALPEFALVIPVLALVLFAVLHFGKAFDYWNSATHISAEGARYAAVNGKPYPTNPASLQTQLLEQSATPELRDGGTESVPNSEVCIDFPDGVATRGHPVRVTMRFTYAWVPLSRITLFGRRPFGVTETTVTASSVMRLETSPTNYAAGCA